MRLLRRPRFYADVAEEVEYLATLGGPELALRWSRALEDTIQQLLRQPKVGRPRPDLTPRGVRSWRMERFRRWLVFYQLEGKSLVLLRVRYGMMDLSSLKLD